MMPILSVVVPVGPTRPSWEDVPLFAAALRHHTRRYGIAAELILVDWAPAADHIVPFLPSDSSCPTRIISVPRTVLSQAGFAEDLGFRERLAQNIGIRRAAGTIVLTATLEVILTDTLAAWLGSLESLADRVVVPHRWLVFTRSRSPGEDAPSALQAGVPALLDWCTYATGVIDASPRWVSFTAEPVPKHAPAAAIRAEYLARARALSDVDDDAPMRGNCSLLIADRSVWLAIGGYPEWPVHDRFLDRLVLMQAQQRGFHVETLPPEQFYFHLYELRPPITAAPLPVAIADDGTRLVRPERPRPLAFSEGQAEALLPELASRIAALPAGATVTANESDWGLAGFDLPELRL
jgi:hypothetical protein